MAAYNEKLLFRFAILFRVFDRSKRADLAKLLHKAIRLKREQDDLYHAIESLLLGCDTDLEDDGISELITTHISGYMREVIEYLANEGWVDVPDDGRDMTFDEMCQVLLRNSPIYDPSIVSK